MLRIDLLPGIEGTGGTSPEPAQQRAQFLPYNLLAEQLVRQSKVGQEMIVKEMPEGAVSDVMHQRRDPEKLLDKRGGGAVLALGRDHLTEGGIKMPCKSSRNMHGPDGVLKAAVLGGRVDPPGALKLIDVPKPLQPVSVNEVFLGRLLFTIGKGDSEGNVLMNGIGDQREPFIGSVFDHGSLRKMLISPGRHLSFPTIMPHDRDPMAFRSNLPDGECRESSRRL